MSSEIVPAPVVELVESSEVPSLLDKIRPAWKSKNLIQRVRRLIHVDPSSACQRIFNAAIHDLREKIIIAGIDIAAEAAKQYKLPPITSKEDIERYPTSKIIDLAYRIGILTRPEWRRLCRCYEIRRDLEHEDNEYEAGIEDCVYIFQTCINVVLAKDPIDLIRVTDVKNLIEQPEPAIPSPSLLEDYERAPQPRQEEILKFLISVALNEKHPELVRQNAFTFLKFLSERTQNSVKLNIAQFVQEKIKKNGISLTIMRIAYIAGVFPYLKRAYLKDFFLSFFKRMQQIGYRWTSYPHHGTLLRSLKEVGGLLFIPKEIRYLILKWLILAYLGEPGGVTSWGTIRHVFYSDTAAPIVEELVSEASDIVKEDFQKLENDKDIKRAIINEHIQRRFDKLLDLIQK